MELPLEPHKITYSSYEALSKNIWAQVRAILESQDILDV